MCHLLSGVSEYSFWILTTFGVSSALRMYVRPITHTRVYGERILRTPAGSRPCQPRRRHCVVTRPVPDRPDVGEVRGVGIDELEHDEPPPNDGHVDDDRLMAEVEPSHRVERVVVGRDDRLVRRIGQPADLGELVDRPGPRTVGHLDTGAGQEHAVGIEQRIPVDIRPESEGERALVLGRSAPRYVIVVALAEGISPTAATSTSRPTPIPAYAPNSEPPCPDFGSGVARRNQTVSSVARATSRFP